MPKAEGSAPFRLASGDRVAIVAGSGRLPIDLAEGLAAQGHKPFIVMIEGEADSSSVLVSTMITLGWPGRVSRVLQRFSSVTA